MVEAEKFTERRQHERLPLMMPAETLFEGATLDTVILDISLGGAKIRLTDAELHPTDIAKAIVLDIPKAGTMEGEVIWIDDEYVGIKFDDGQKTMLNLVLYAIPGGPGSI